VSFYYNDNTYIGYTNVTLDLFDDDSGAVYIRLPDSPDFQYFTVDNNAHITFSPTFYQHDDYLGFFYEQGLPTYQTVEWEEINVEDGYLPIDLDKEIFNISETVYVFNDQYEFIYALDPDVREQEEEYNGQTYTLEFNNVSIPESYIFESNTMEMKDGDLLFLKYNASLEESIGITVEDMVIQKEPYIKNYETGLNDIPIAEISLLGINNDGETYTTDDLYESREKLVAWNTPLDLTPFENVFYNEYKQAVINVSLADFYSDFKVMDEESIEHSYITDVLITSNDPRYELIIDSIFLFEFEENTTLYDSDIFDIFENNHMEKFYVGDYTDIYGEVITLDASEFLPLYQDDSAINETYYFDAFDSDGNWYHFDEHLSGEETTSGIYDITWNSQYNREYYLAYRDQKPNLQELFEDYNPHIDTFRYLYVSWADQNTWNEWHTIETPNINSSSLDITFEWYDDGLEEYDSVSYDQSLNEFEAKNVAVETIYPYNSDLITDMFDLSQDYINAQDLEIMMIKGYFFNESSKDFDHGLAIFPDEKSIRITAPDNLELRNFEKIVIYLNFTEGAYSDYTRFRLLSNAIEKSGSPAWTKNDSIYVDYEYSDIDYFLLMEDYAVGSEDSLFEYIEYVRNDNFVEYDHENLQYYFTNDITDFDNFTKKDDKRTVLEFYDLDLNGEHELVVQKEDVDVNGIYDVFKYGIVNPAGEISFHTTLIKITSTNVETRKTGDVRKSKFYQMDISIYHYVQRTVATETTTTTTSTKTTVVVQKDHDLDGTVDEDVTFEAMNSVSVIVSFTTETDWFYTDDIFSDTYMPDGSITEYRNSTRALTDKSQSFIFRDYENGELNSTRIYDDVFPNELSEKYNVNNYLKTIVNDNGDEDPLNDLVLEAPALEDLISFRHTTDEVPAIFDRKITINSPAVITNILATNKTVSIPDAKNAKSGLNKASSTLEIIEVIPDDGEVIYNSNPRYSPRLIKIGGSYWHFSSTVGGNYDSAFVVDEDENIVAIVLDYDYNFILEPNKKLFTEKHIMGIEGQEGQYHNILTDDKRVYLQDYSTYDGISLDPTLSDSLYDIWKLVYDSDTSKLIREVMAITSSQFVHSVKGRILDDIIWQIGTQVVSWAVATALSYVPYIGPLLAIAGYAIVYGLLNAWRTAEEYAENQQDINSLTLNPEGYEGPMTLSTLDANSELWGGTLPDLIYFGSSAGVYVDIFLEHDKHRFNGKILLSPQGVQKTTDLGFRNVPVNLNYGLQTRSYQAYSDITDYRLSAHLYTYSVEGNEYHDDYIVSENTEAGDDLSNSYMPNSIMFLETSISQKTEGEYDTIYPYIMYLSGTFIPTFQFAGAETGFPVPEFYHEYPIFVDPDTYSELEEQCFTIYKVFDSESSQDIELIPENTLHGDVRQIHIYRYTTTNDPVPANVIGSEFAAYDLNMDLDSYSDDSYTYNAATGVVTLKDNLYSYLISTAKALETAHSEDPDYEVFYVLEIDFEQYRSMDDLRGMTREQVDHIATMQAVEQSILEYTYQFIHAQRTQQGLSEMCYTTVVTVISTIAATIITLGAGALLKKVIPATFTTASGKVVTVTGEAASKSLQQLTKFISRSQSALAILFSFVQEPLQEIFIDPVIETIVTNIIAQVGGDIFAQIFWSSMAEAGRETLTGSMSGFLFGNTQSLFNTQEIFNEIQSDQSNTLDAISESESHTQVKPKWGQILKGGIFLLLGTALVGIGGPAALGASLVSGYIGLKALSHGFTIQKTIIHNIISEQLPRDYYLSNVIADETNALIAEDIEDVIKWGQMSTPSIEVPNPDNIIVKTSKWGRVGRAVIGAIPIIAGGLVATINPIAGIMTGLMSYLGMVNSRSDLLVKSDQDQRQEIISERFEISSKIKGMNNDINLKNGIISSEYKFGFDPTDPNEDLRIVPEIRSMENKKRAKLQEQLKEAQLNNNKELIERLKIEIKLDLPAHFSIHESVRLNDPSVIDYLKRCKEDYLKIPARFRGEESPSITFYDSLLDNSRFDYASSKDREAAKVAVGGYIYSGKVGQIILATNKELNPEGFGGTISPITHEFGHFIEKSMGRKSTSKMWKAWMEIYQGIHENKESFRALKQSGDLRRLVKPDELLADSFMEFTTGGLRLSHIQNNVIKNIGDGSIDLNNILIRMLENVDFNSYIIHYLEQKGLLNELKFIVSYSNGRQLRCESLSELREIYDGLRIGEDIKINILQGESFLNRKAIIESIIEILTPKKEEILDSGSRKIRTKSIALNIFGIEMSIPYIKMLKDVVKNIEKYGEGDEKYLPKGHGLLDEFNQIQEFLTNYLGTDHYKGDLIKYQNYYILYVRDFNP
jgi:hypothetical protein